MIYSKTSGSPTGPRLEGDNNMETLVFILIIILVGIVLNKLARFFNNLAITFQKEKDEEAKCWQKLTDSVKDLKVTEDKNVAENQQEALFRANKALLEKKKVQEAMKEELGID